MRRSRLRIPCVVVLGLALVGISACGGTNPNSELDRYLADGTVTDGEYEQAWREVVECLESRGAEAHLLRTVFGKWQVEISGLISDRLYQSCAALADQVSTAYFRERVPTGQDRLALVVSLRECLAVVGVTEVPIDDDTRRANAVLASAIEQLGYKGGESELTDDPRFNAVLDCLGAHELLFPARFDSNEQG